MSTRGDRDEHHVLPEHDVGGGGGALHRVESTTRSNAESEYYEAQSQMASEDDLDRSNKNGRKLTAAQSQRLEHLQSQYWFPRFRQRCGDVVNHTHVQLGIIGLIVINAIMMGLATFDFVKDDPDVNRAFETTDKVFLGIFTGELLLQFIYRGWKLFLDGWLVFDFVIILLSWGFESIQVIRAFRIFRGFRLVTRVKVLRDLVIAIGAVLPRMAAIGFLLCLIFYIFAVLFTSLFKDLPLEGANFRSLDVSLFTCTEMMTLEWAGLAREVMSFESWAWLPFVTFIAVSGFIVFNLIIAVVCDAVAIADAESRKLETDREDTPEETLVKAQIQIRELSGRIQQMHTTQEIMLELLENLTEQVGASVGDERESHPHAKVPTMTIRDTLMTCVESVG